MEPKAWGYDKFPAFDEEVEGAQWLDTSVDGTGIASRVNKAACTYKARGSSPVMAVG